MKVKLQFAVILLFWTCNASSATRYVNQENPAPTPPFSDWSSAATNIQDAIDIADAGDLVLVTNGVYKTGGRVVPSEKTTNRVAITKAVTVKSVNGPEVTVIEGFQVPGTIFGSNAVRCVYLTNDSSLIGFTLTNGSTFGSTSLGDRTSKRQSTYGGGALYSSLLRPSISNSLPLVADCVISGNAAAERGGGAYGLNLSNCIVRGNFANVGGGVAACSLINCVVVRNTAAGAYPSGSYLPRFPSYKPNGGGAYGGQLENCLIIGNSADHGGGTYGSGLKNCTVVSNTAFLTGGGVAGVYSPWSSGLAEGAIVNCIILFNSASNSPNYQPGMTNIAYSCTTPLLSGVENFTNDPVFVDIAAGDFQLQSNSPCINAGRKLSHSEFDLSGNPRVVGGSVDVGAHEFQSPVSQLSYAWAMQYGIPLDGSLDFLDLDGDGMNNQQEMIAGTNPTNQLSVLAMQRASPALSFSIVRWNSAPGRMYFLQRASDLTPTAFTTISSNIASQGATTFTFDSTATGLGPFFYRVGLQETQ